MPELSEANKKRLAHREECKARAIETGLPVLIDAPSGGWSSDGFCVTVSLFTPDGEWRIIRGSGPPAQCLDGSWDYWKFSTNDEAIVTAIKNYKY